MAILYDKIRGNIVQTLEMNLSKSSHASSLADWINAKISFKFWSGFPEISIERDGQDQSDMYMLIDELKEIAKNPLKKNLDFYPTEPDYNITINKTDEDIEVVVVFDVTGTQTTGVYCGRGPSIIMSVTKEDILTFAQELENEIKSIF